MDLIGLSFVITSCSSLVAATASAVVLMRVKTVDTKVDEVKQQVKTSNGLTLAVLADRDEGRRIESNILEDSRTEDEKRYVTELHKDD